MGTLIPCSFLCGILSFVFIWQGGQKTKRTEEVKERLMAALATDGQFDAGPGFVSALDKNRLSVIAPSTTMEKNDPRFRTEMKTEADASIFPTIHDKNA
jgi:septum formation topological specificity factor MinE